MYGAIVVGTDGSRSAGEAVRHAARLAKAIGATLHVVHAFKLVAAMPAFGPDSDVVAPPMGVSDAVETDAKAVLADAIATARAEGARAEGRLCRDDAANALVETAEQIGAGLVVVGNKGMSGVKRFVLGSVPNKVSHHCACSLLIVHTSG